MASQPTPAPYFTDAQLESIALLNVGYASEVKNKPSYQLSIAWQEIHASKNPKHPTNPPKHEHIDSQGVKTIYQHVIGDKVPIGDSGYSVGSMQTDFGQRSTFVNDFVAKYESWAGGDPNKLIDNSTDLRVILKTKGKQLDANRVDMSEWPIPAEDSAKFNAYLKSDQGRQDIWELDQKQIQKLIPFAKKVMATPMFQALTDDAEKINVISTTMKLYNQAEGKANGLLKKMESGKLNSFADIETEINIGNYKTFIQTGFKGTKEGAELYNKILGSNSVVRGWLVNHGTANLNTLNEIDYKDNPEFQVLNRLFRDPIKGKTFVDRLEQGLPVEPWNVPSALNDGTNKVIAVDKNGIVYTIDPDGKNVHQFINGHWEQKEGGEPVIKRGKDGKWILALGEVEIDFGNAAAYAYQQPNQEATVSVESDPTAVAEALMVDAEVAKTNPKALEARVVFETVEEMLKENGRLSPFTREGLDKKVAERTLRLNENENGYDSWQERRQALDTHRVLPQSNSDQDFNPKSLNELIRFANSMPEGQLRGDLSEKIAGFMNEKGYKVHEQPALVKTNEPATDV